jgi:sterol desaturase/sphingolipid hydroxylase (fatty acid hydroxylase superfamily)
LPCFALGYSEWSIAAFAFLYHWHSLLLHANLDFGFGPLSRIFASPTFHRWHHCREREAWDRNFAGQLAFWDFLFGTAYLPADRKASAFGIGEVVPNGYVAQLAAPFRRRDSAAVREIG